MKVLLAGAGGQVGRRVHQLLLAKGHEVNALTGLDLTRPHSAAGVAAGCQVAVSCAGGSVSLAHPERRGYRQVDPLIHAALLPEIQRAGIKRFVYLGVHIEEGYRNTAYVEAHERVVDMLRAAALDFTVVRPTGIFTAFEDLLPLARWRLCPQIGGGLARTNPIDPQDVAELIVDHLLAGPADLPCGGPETFTRRQIQEVVCGPGVWMPVVPPGLLHVQSRLVGLFHPRLRDLIDFFAAVSTHDAIAPATGKRRLADYFAARLAVQAR